MLFFWLSSGCVGAFLIVMISLEEGCDLTLGGLLLSIASVIFGPITLVVGLILFAIGNKTVLFKNKNK